MKHEAREKQTELRAQLYANRLGKGEGKFIAKPRIQSALDVGEVCASAIKRGGVNLSQAEMVKAVEAYHEEVAYKIGDGKAVSNSLFSINPVIKGTFLNETSVFDRKKHKLSLSFKPKSILKQILEAVVVKIDGVATTDGLITSVIDENTEARDQTITSKGVVSLEGRKIAVKGDHADVGVYLIRQDCDCNNESCSHRLKVTGRFLKNTANRLTFILPELPQGKWRFEVVTQYAGSTQKFLKEPRIFSSKVDLLVA
jgi:hypothetical protein